MNDMIEEAMNKTLKTMELWEETKDRPTAQALQMQLSIMKLLVGNERFDGLPAFSRILKEVTLWIDEDDKLKAEFKKAQAQIPEAIDAMLQAVRK